jgi:hypothetical protein
MDDRGRRPRRRRTVARFVLIGAAAGLGCMVVARTGPRPSETGTVPATGVEVTTPTTAEPSTMALGRVEAHEPAAARSRTVPRTDLPGRIESLATPELHEPTPTAAAMRVAEAPATTTPAAPSPTTTSTAAPTTTTAPAPASPPTAPAPPPTTTTTTPATVPGPPRTVGAFAGDGSLRVSWIAPASTGGSPIQGYLVAHRHVGDVAWTAVAGGVSTTTATTITGLADGVTYEVRVAAVNAVGTSEWATTSATVRPLWTPADLDGVVRWLDAADTATLTDAGGAITGWADRSAGSRDLQQPATGRRPSSGVLTSNGRNLVVFDGDDDVLTHTGTLPASAAMTVAVAATPTAGQGGHLFTMTNAALERWSLRTGYDGNAYDLQRIGDDAQLGLGTRPPTSLATVIVRQGPTATTSWVDGTPSASGPGAGGRSFDRLTLGAAADDGTAAAATSVGEVLVVAAALSDDDAARLAGYLAWKWGTVAALPAAHPYRNAPPLRFPAAPAALTTTAGESRLTLGWNAPADDGGAPVTGYVVQYRTTPAGAWTTVAGGVGPGATATLTGLTPDTAHEVRVAATTARGTGPWSSSATATPYGPYPTWPALPTGADIGRALSSWTPTGSATAGTAGSGLTGPNKWFGSVVAPNGKIYGIPFWATSILVIDPAANGGAGGVTTSAMGVSLGDAGAKWAGGVLAPNGKIYAIPRTAPDILVIDPVAGTAQRTAMGANLTGTDKWTGGVLAPNGKIYAIPENANDILVIDPAAGAATRTTMDLTMPAGTSRWSSAVLAPNGKIYGIPRNGSSVLVIDPQTDTASMQTFGLDLSDGNKWGGGVLGPDGKIYAIPLDATSILVIDPVAGTATRTTMGATLTGSAKWGGGALGADGRIYGVPRNSTDLLVIDTGTGTASRSSLGATFSSSTLKWIGAVLGAGGQIWAVPYNETSVLRVTTRGTGATNLDVLLSPFLNGY